MRSPVSNHVFSRTPSVDMPRSAFRRDRTYKTAFNAGLLVPVFCDEVLPGDTWRLNLSAFARLATPVVPFMDNLYMDIHFFFVPCRLLWSHWEHFNGFQESPGDSTDYLLPQLVQSPTNGWQVGSLHDYLGLPVNVGKLKVNALPFRAYNLVWNEYYRDENYQDSVEVPKDDGPDPATYTDGDGHVQQMYKLLPRGKRKDYFTSCLPSPQKGPGVEIPLGGNAPVEYITPTSSSDVEPFNLYSSTGDVPSQNRLLAMQGGSSALKSAISATIGSTTGAASASTFGAAYYVPKLVARLDQTNAVTINTMRQAFQLQRLFERDNLGGTRYFETLVAHFRVRSPDARLQRPEYLGGGTLPIQVHTVTQTSATDDVSPQGNLAAVGVAGSASAVRWSKSFVEHGYVLGLASVRADLTYQQGIDRMWSRRTRFDFYWPALAHLGEQAVLNKEIYADGSDDDDVVFGYQERWAEYRYGISKITGILRSGVTGSLDVWHLGQYFDNRPTLSAQFVQEDPPISRVVAVQDEPQLIYDSLVSLQCIRPMPVYSVPGLIDHF